MRRATLLLLLACSSSSSSKDEAPKPPPPATPKTVDKPADKPAEKPADKPVAKPVASKATPPPITDEDKKQHDKYRKAMQRGRKLTDEKKYADAIRAFDEAIDAKKFDARAVSERGFARLLAGDLDGASKDFNEAAGASKDSRLLSQIWFNRGLVDEKRDQPDNALADFYLANKLHPTEAAKKKLAGSKACPAHVDHDYSPDFDARTVDAADWLALAKQLPLMDPAALTSPVDARTALGVEEPKLPAIAVAGQIGTGRVAFVVVAHGKGLRAIPIAVDGGARCPGQIQFEVVATRGAVVHVHGTELYEGGITDMCRTKDEELGECTGAPNEEFTGHACFAPDPVVRDMVIDTDSGKLVRIERSQMQEGAEVKVKLDDKGVHLSGLDCDATVNL